MIYGTRVKFYVVMNANNEWINKAALAQRYWSTEAISYKFKLKLESHVSNAFIIY